MDNASNQTTQTVVQPKKSNNKLLIIGCSCLALLAACGGITAAVIVGSKDNNNESREADSDTKVTPTTEPTQTSKLEIKTIPVGRDASANTYENRKEMSAEDIEKFRLDKLAEADGIALELVKKLRDVANFYPEDDGSVPGNEYLDDLDLDIDYTTPTKTPSVTPTKSTTVAPTRDAVTPTKSGSTPTPTEVMEDDWDLGADDESQSTTPERVSPATYEDLLSYVTPNDSLVKEIAKNKTKEELFTQSKKWVWVEDLSLHKVDEHWMKPAKFLETTPQMSSNPKSGRISSDCEEHAFTLVSALRSIGVKPEHVRVSTGKVNFGNSIGGHAWVQLYDEKDGKWFDLEPSSGDSVDPATGTFTESDGLAFDYFKTNKYPVVEQFMYFNDQYFMDFTNNKTNAPDLW